MRRIYADLFWFLSAMIRCIHVIRILFNTYTGVKKAPGLRLCPLTLLLNPTIFEPLRFGELAGGVLPAPALLIGAA
jgi:hypothetical protein